MGILKVTRAGTRAGDRLRRQWQTRGSGVLDTKLTERVVQLVREIRRGGDRALVRSVRKLDGVEIQGAESLRLEPSLDVAPELPPGFEPALERAIASVERYHRHQVHEGFRVEEGGVEWTERRIPLRRVGVYVPGGRAAYPSTAVMTVVPALVAGVEEVVVATPPASWERNPALGFTLARLGVREVWGMGGAHAVAALAYGTESIAPVDKIVGPGNAWVTAAKKLVAGDVAIDSLAGPSEVVIVALGEVDPALVAADLLAQAEHDPQAMSVLVTERRETARAVSREVERQLPRLATAEVAEASLQAMGGAVVVDDLESALDWAEAIAPEHLQLMGDAEVLADRVRCAGAVFIGEATPVVFGDYIAGPSHVLPTTGTARFDSALGVDDFVRRSHLVRYSRTAAARTAAAAAILADVEGLPAHAAAARRRTWKEE